MDVSRTEPRNERLDVETDETTTRENTDTGPPSRRVPLFVVGVGASAGGLEALEQLFSAMPEDTGLAFVVVQHLSPDFKSVMDELLSRRTKIPVLLVEDGVPVEPNRIYLIPAKKEMIISGGRLLLSDKGASQELTLPIDIFFRSLAEDLGSRSIGIVLSGAGSDGARGIRDIHAAGGLVLCQDESTANFDGMPRSARETGVVDHVLAPVHMPDVLVQHARVADHRSLAAVAAGTAAPPSGVPAVLSALQHAYGIDFSQYKPTTVFRRIERRLQLTDCTSVEAYIDRLSGDGDELDALFRDLLIGVTRFFRDSGAFEYLETSVIPELLERTQTSHEFRAWIAGCATGEEAYSIAMLLQQGLAKRGDRRRLKILATDVHPGSLDFASRGLYEEERLAHVRPELLERYFTKSGPNYQVSPELRQLIVFASHNVLKDAPFTRLDLIGCRNLLIYLQPLAQRKVLHLLHFALKRHGVLFLGPSESAGPLADDFETLDAHWRIYRKHRDVKLPNDTRLAPPARPAQSPHGDGGAGLHVPGYSLSQVLNVYDALLDEHMTPSLLVSERRQLIHAFAGASKYLRSRDGRPSGDILDMLEPELRMAVTGAIQRALKERQTVVYSGLRVKLDGEEKCHRLSVKPIETPKLAVNHVLVTIEEGDLPGPPLPSPETEVDLSQISTGQLSSLEAELRRTKESLQATIEELETSNEELQAANEELLASNEELQSTNEELQSVNEELYTVNAEYQKKISELTELTNDMDNLLASIEVGTIFLDHNLCIRKFTPRIAEAFNLLPQDVGRPISGFSNNLMHPGLMGDLALVLRSERAIEREVCDQAGNWFFLRILAYRARHAVAGVVLTLIDIAALKAAEDAVFRERYLLNSLMDSVPDSIYFKDSAGRFVRINKAMAARFGLQSAALAVGRTATELLPEAVAKAFEALDGRALGGERQDYQDEHYAIQGEPCYFTTTRQPLRDRDDNLVGMLGVVRDVTAQKNAEQEIRLAVKRRDEFLAMLSHELRNPLAAIVSASVLLEQVGDLSSSYARSVAVLKRQSRQMSRLLDDLLEVSRITQNKIELRKQVVDARAILSDAVAATHDKFETHEVTLEVRLGDEPVLVDADPARLQQVAVNLLDNAAKYNRRGGRAALTLERQGASAVVRVTDDGIGIEEALQRSIFEPFVQGTAALKRPLGGMGVGLSVVRALVDMHGGNVEAYSDGPDRGSQFTVSLPLSRAAAPSRLRHQAIEWPRAGRVVIIEDNPDGREMLQLLLEQGGHEVFAAADGKSGIEVIDRVEPDVAIVDIGLPIMNGLEVARQVRSRPKHKELLMVALTGYGQAADQAAALEAGFDQHLVKPLDPEEFVRWACPDRESPEPK